MWPKSIWPSLGCPLSRSRKLNTGEKLELVFGHDEDDRKRFLTRVKRNKAYWAKMLFVDSCKSPKGQSDCKIKPQIV